MHGLKTEKGVKMSPNKESSKEERPKKKSHVELFAVLAIFLIAFTTGFFFTRDRLEKPMEPTQVEQAESGEVQ